jgi:hypothetical protein
MSGFARGKLGPHARVSMVFSSLMRPMTVINGAASAKTRNANMQKLLAT